VRGRGLEDCAQSSLLMCEGGRPLVGGPRLGDGVQYSLRILEGGRPREGVPSAKCCGGGGHLDAYKLGLGLGNGVLYSLLVLDGGRPRLGVPPSCGGRGARGGTDLRPPSSSSYCVA
jgi:hypothetical protein